MSNKRLITWLAIAVLTLVISDRSEAQSFRYIDEAGNIHWADSVGEIPRRYRDQVLEPTPVPTGKLRRPTPTPKPTKTPKPKKKKKKDQDEDRDNGEENKEKKSRSKGTKKAKSGDSIFPSDYGAPGQLPTRAAPNPSVVVPTVVPTAAAAK